MVEVNNHLMHVYSEGDGEKTFVFLAGGGTSSPLLDFKPLYCLLSDENRIAVVEKAGYGFSEITDSNRDIHTILHETREALQQAKIEGPYILVPLSMSGVETLYWAQTYPEEVEAIIGLDMAVPSVYEEMDIPMPLIRLGEFIAKTGLIRWLPMLDGSDLMNNKVLKEEDKALYEIVFYRRTLTKNMLNEVKEIKENARVVERGDKPEVPMLLFVSNGEDTGFDSKLWTELQQDFAKIYDQEIIKLDASHYIHHTEFKKIAEEMDEFIERMSSRD
ncbi:alpha/beta hydrolase [Oceanobacillus indicireducens]|uniref:Alpha/beta hydrolase n=1 Tax=Oceanobacillus indicireducens TaxID=1004261 RepID=A0A918D1P1_9BACI|nr:alpha/beta hydrolase [Oceanobacillus indicireducens]